MCATQAPVPQPSQPGTSSAPTPSGAAPHRAGSRPPSATPVPAGTAVTASSPGASTAPAAPDAAAYGAVPPQRRTPVPPVAAATPDSPTRPVGIEAGIAALADSLSACADTLHERIMQAIRQRPPARPADAGQDPAPDTAQDLDQGMTQGGAQALFDQEVLLRQYANTLYVQAAVLATSGLDSVRAELMEVTASARDTLRQVARVQVLVALAADLVTLAGALAAGQPAQWPAAIRQVRDRVTALRQPGPG